LFPYSFLGFLKLKDRGDHTVRVHFGWISDVGMYGIVADALWPHVDMTSQTIRSVKVFGVGFTGVKRRHLEDPETLTTGTLKVVPLLSSEFFINLFVGSVVQLSR
jgi:hypothetical protein